MNQQGLADEARASATGRGADALVCVVLFAFTFWYCASAPYNLYVYDEGFFLYEAKRILDGEVFYRDIFDIVTPLAWYVMAGAYWLFGVSMATARTTMAVVHGAIAVGMVIACRTVGARLSLAAVAALSETAVCYMAIERAAPHWFGTLLCVAILLALLRQPLTVGRNAFLAGVLVGVLILTQQQRGVAMVWVPVVVLVIDQWLLIPAPNRLVRQLVANATLYAGGILVLVVPVMLTFVVLAGFDNVWIALVHYPLFNYRSVNQTSWGAYNPIQDRYIGPVFKYLSLAIPTAAAFRCAWLWRMQASPTIVRTRLVTLLVSVGALLGISYVPGYAYIVLAGPVWFTLIADVVEAALRRGERRSLRGWMVATAVVAACAIFFAVRLLNRRQELKGQWPYVGDTPFGQLAFSSQADIDMLDALKKIVGAPTELFIYPTAPGLYLMTGTSNPTRFHIMFPGYSSAEHWHEVIDVLERRRFPYVLRNWIWMDNTQDVLFAYLLDKYERVALPYPPKQIRLVTLFRRKPDTKAPGTF